MDNNSDNNRYNRYFGDPYWDTRKGFMYYAFYKMTRWMSSVDVVYCEPNMPSRGEGAAQFGHRIRQVIASSIGLNCVDFNGMAKRDLLKALQEDEEESKKLR
jgi:glycerol-3-phosphate O-acyltransferase 3/4